MDITFSKGDVVTLRGTVEVVFDEAERGISVKIDGYYSSIYVTAKDLTLVHRHFAIGDRIRSPAIGAAGFIRAIYAGLAWVEAENPEDGYVTEGLEHLEHAPAQPIAAIAAEAEAA